MNDETWKAAVNNMARPGDVSNLILENERLRTRIKWFEDAGGVAMATRFFQMEAERDRWKAAHDHQYGVAGTMLREAERVGRENDTLRALLADIRENGINAPMEDRIDDALQKDKP